MTWSTNGKYKHVLRRFKNSKMLCYSRFSAVFKAGVALASLEANGVGFESVVVV